MKMVVRHKEMAVRLQDDARVIHGDAWRFWPVIYENMEICKFSKYFKKLGDAGTTQDDATTTQDDGSTTEDDSTTTQDDSGRCMEMDEDGSTTQNDGTSTPGRC